MKHPALRSYDYHLWANETVVSHLKTLPEEVYAQEVQSVFPSISAVLGHVYLVDNIWLSAMSQLPYNELYSSIAVWTEEAKGASLERMEEFFGACADRYHTFLRSRKDLDAAITLNHPELGELTAPLSQLIHHVVNHGTYHRGNITAMLRQMGHKGVPTDYIFLFVQDPRHRLILRHKNKRYASTQMHTAFSCSQIIR